jgi:hypothetical protein
MAARLLVLRRASTQVLLVSVRRQTWLMLLVLVLVLRVLVLVLVLVLVRALRVLVLRVLLLLIWRFKLQTLISREQLPLRLQILRVLLRLLLLLIWRVKLQTLISREQLPLLVLQRLKQALLVLLNALVRPQGLASLQVLRVLSPETPR